MEGYKDFLHRTGSFIHTSLPENGDLPTAPRLAEKVAADGRMLPFGGNTVVFRLPADMTGTFAQMQQALYAACGDILAEPLRPETFHITLHDLMNGKPGAALEAAVRETTPAALAVTERIRQENFRIRMQSSCMFSLASIAVVVGFSAADEASHQLLMDYYDRYQSVVPLPHPLTPHVTLAYYRPGVIPAAQLRALQSCIDAAARTPLTLTLTPDLLHCMTFTDMRHYAAL